MMAKWEGPYRGLTFPLVRRRRCAIKFYPKGQGPVPVLIRVKQSAEDTEGRTIVRGWRLDYVPDGMSKVYDAAGKLTQEIPTFLIVSVEDEPR